MIAVVVAFFLVCLIAVGVLISRAPEIEATPPPAPPVPPDPRSTDPFRVIGGSGAGSSTSYFDEVER